MRPSARPAFAAHTSKDAFLVGMAASVGAGISMGFAEVMSDDGVLSSRGRPWARGTVWGLMTTLGGIGHTLPFLISNFYYVMSIVVAIVVVELAVIAWIHCPQEVKDVVEDGTKVGGARSPARTSRRQNRGNLSPCRLVRSVS